MSAIGRRGAIGGVITAMATPFDEHGTIDAEAVARLARHLVTTGSEGIVVAGTTGESPTLDDSEKLALLDLVLEEVGGEATVILGTGSNDTAHSVKLTRAAAERGAAGCLVVTPYYNKPNRAGILRHFEAVCEAAGKTPVIAYNIPSRTVVNMPAELLTELGLIENLVAVKQANNDEIADEVGLDVLAGNDDVFLTCLQAGGVGGILVASHVAGERMREMLESARAGDWERARAIDEELRPLYRALSVATNPIPVKAALELMGLCGPTMRLPMVPATPDERAHVAEALRALGVVEGTG